MGLSGNELPQGTWGIAGTLLVQLALSELEILTPCPIPGEDGVKKTCEGWAADQTKPFVLEQVRTPTGGQQEGVPAAVTHGTQGFAYDLLRPSHTFGREEAGCSSHVEGKPTDPTLGKIELKPTQVAVSLDNEGMDAEAMFGQILGSISDINLPRLAPASITQALDHSLFKL